MQRMLPLANVAGDPEIQDQKKWKGPCWWAKTRPKQVTRRCSQVEETPEGRRHWWRPRNVLVGQRKGGESFPKKDRELA